MNRKRKKKSWISRLENVLLLAVMLAMLIVFLCNFNCRWESCKVIESHDGIVVVMDRYGEQWVFTTEFKDVDTYVEGDVVDCKLYNKGTEPIYDDEVVDVIMVRKTR